MSVPRIILSSWLSVYQNYQIWWRFDEVLTKTSWVIFWPTLYTNDVKAARPNYSAAVSASQYPTSASAFASD